MQRIDTPTAVNGHFVNANPNIGRMATRLDESWFNAVQEELCNVVEGLGNALDKEKRNQIISALASRIFDYREVNAAVTPSITLSTLMKKTIVKMTGRTLTVNGEFDVLVVIPGNADVVNMGSTITVGVSGSAIRVGRGLVIWGDQNYSRFPSYPNQDSVAIESSSVTLPTDISEVPASSVAIFSIPGEHLRTVDVSATVLLCCQSLNPSNAEGAAWICNSSGVALKKVPFKFLKKNQYTDYIPISLRFVYNGVDSGSFSLRLACTESVFCYGGSLSFVTTDL